MSQQTAQNINNEFFKGIYKEVWRKEIPDGLTEAEVDFIEEIGGLTKGDHVLDLMCGYGRHALELGRRGYKVTALDNSEPYISEINEKSKSEKLLVYAFDGDVSQITYPGSADMVINMGNSFAFFNAEASALILEKIAASLKQNGVLLINSWMIAEIAIKSFQERSWHYIDEYKFIQESQYLFHPTRIETNYTILAPTGAMENLKGIDYIFSFSELEAMLDKAGFKMEEIYSTPRKRKYRFGETRAYIVARKQ
jgi:SAM-dependent methyltransferase